MEIGTIQESPLGKCCGGMRDLAASTLNWIGRTVTDVGSFVLEGAKDIAEKVADFIKPRFNDMKDFVLNNRANSLALVTVGVLGALIARHVFCRGTNTPPPATNSQPATA
jgi:hypothetical protein